MCLCCISHCKNPKCLFSDFVRMDICLITQLRSLFQSFFFSIIQFFRVFSLFVILASILSRIFFFHIATSDRNLVLTAMAEWELVTCVQKTLHPINNCICCIINVKNSPLQTQIQTHRCTKTCIDDIRWFQRGCLRQTTVSNLANLPSALN